MKVERCLICEKVRFCEQDHVIPKVCGGTEKWPLCESCHSMSDRMPIKKWDPDEALASMRDFWTKCGPEGRMWMMKMLKTAAHAHEVAERLAERLAEINAARRNR